MRADNTKYLKPFPKGVSGNPGGGRKLPSELRKARQENTEGLIKIITTYISLTREQALLRTQGPETLLLEEMIMGQINKASEGDSRAFQFLVEIMCGKIPESDDAPTSDTMTPQEKLELMEKATEALRAQIGADPSRTSD
jgi:hypothetical protein